MDKQDHMQELVEIRSMMERSTRFLSLSGWAGVLAGVYALVGAYIAQEVLHFSPQRFDKTDTQLSGSPVITKVTMLAVVIMVLALGTAILLSMAKAQHRGEKAWNAASRRLMLHMAVPLLTGGAVILTFLSNGMTGLLIPFTLIFYGLALFNASNFTYNEVKHLGLIQVSLGLLSLLFIPYSVLFWAAGFGVMHMVYGIYIYYRYER